ncbi:MAG: hypothetical protein HZA52_20785 [Planctomycetes bacterium]|nr:hypothetical protein [Planctomycetota bacterium]
MLSIERSDYGFQLTIAALVTLNVWLHGPALSWYQPWSFQSWPASGAPPWVRA